MPLSALNPNVPGEFSVAINGVVYPVKGDGMKRASLPMLAWHMDNSAEPNENTLSPLDLWRRTFDDWSMGAGQIYADPVHGETDVTHSRFLSSKGIDPWQEGTVCLLNSTQQVIAVGGTPASQPWPYVQCIVAGNRLYYAQLSASGSSLQYTTDGSTWTTVSSSISPSVASMATDGFNVYIDEITGLQYTDTSRSTLSSASAIPYGLTAWVKNRLMSATLPIASGAGGVENILSLSGSPASVDLSPIFMTSPNGWKWTAFGEGPSSIFLAGYSGNLSKIFKTTIQTDGTNLQGFTEACTLPPGELVTALFYYQNILFIGTTRGVRCSLVANGAVQPGPLIPVPDGSATGLSTPGVRCFTADDQYVWFGWSGYDTTSSGLGRLNLAKFTLPLKPAYASDLMCNAAGGVVTSVVSFLGKRWFTISGCPTLASNGLYAEVPTIKVSSGTLVTSGISFGVPDSKFFHFVELRHQALSGTGTVSFTANVDGGATAPAQTSSGSGSTGGTFPLADGSGPPASSLFGDNLTLTWTINQSGSPGFGTPVVTRYSIRATPSPRRGEQIVITIDNREAVLANNEASVAMDPRSVFETLKALELAGNPVTLQIGANERYEALIDSIQVDGQEYTSDFNWWQGDLILTLRTFQ